MQGMPRALLDVSHMVRRCPATRVPSAGPSGQEAGFPTNSDDGSPARRRDTGL